MILSFNRLRFICLLAALCCGLAGQARALDIEAVRFGIHPDKTRIVLEMSEEVNFRVGMLDHPIRLGIDLPSFIWQAGEMQRPRGSIIDNLRYGAEQPGLSRIVISLKSPHRIREAFTLPAKEGFPPRLVIDLVRTDDNGFRQALNTTLGNLAVAAAAPPRGAAQAPTAVENRPQLLVPPQQATTAPQPLPVNRPENEAAGVLPGGEKPLIVIDAGHGGTDPGAKAFNGTHEKNIVLPLTQELKRKLEDSGRYRVRLTRQDDTYIKLRRRVELSREWGADMFISLHADSIAKPDVQGASIYTLSNKASDEQTAKLAESENMADLIAGVDLSHEDEDIADILIDLATRDTMNQSRYFANVLVDQFRHRNIQTLPNAHRYAGFAVLKAPDVPSVLIEAGFLSNREEAKLLSQKSYRAKIVDGITAGVNTYFMRVTENTTGQ